MIMAKDKENDVDNVKAKKDPEQEEDIYEKDEREKMEDDAEISPREGGFVEGYEEDEAKSMKKKKEKKK